MAVVKKIKQDQKNIKSLIYSAEELLKKSVQHLFPDSWNEEDASSLICRSMASFLNDKTVQVFGNSVNLKAASYKNISDLKRFSSIGIHMTINFHDGQELNGICFYDIHLRDRNKHTFSSIRKDHLRSMNAHSRQARLLLLDYDPIPVESMAVGPDFMVGGSPHSWHHWMPVTHATAVPVETVLHLGEKTRSLYKLSLPFSYQIVFRHPFGLDLQHNEAATNILTGHKSDRGTPSNILQISANINSSVGELPNIGLEEAIYR